MRDNTGGPNEEYKHRDNYRERTGDPRK